MLSPTSARGDSITMTVLADKISRGSRLTSVEQNIAVSSAAKMYSDSFGPSPGDFHIKTRQLPENVKGALASFSL